MKLLKIQIKGIAKHEDTTIDINRPLTVLFGDVQQGKTTVLNAVRWGLGCQVPDNVIKSGCTEGEIELTFDTGHSKRSFYINGKGEETARPLEYVENGVKIQKPIEYLSKRINPFLLDNEYFMKMSNLEQLRFFANLFDIDTSDIDVKARAQEEQNKNLRIEIKAIGDINPQKVEKPDVEALKAKKDLIDAENKKLSADYSAILNAYNKREAEISSNGLELIDIDEQIAKLQEKRLVVTDWINNNPSLPTPQEPSLEPTGELEEKISNAKADEIRYENYQKELAKANQKLEKEQSLRSGEQKVREFREEKVKKLTEISSKTGIDGLLFVDGGYTYQGIAFDMLATSQKQDLSNKLSALFPSDFDIDLIDRAESLGKRNLVNLGKLASEKGRTIIATVVSDELAIDDEHVGVFRVENGEVSNG